MRRFSLAPLLLLVAAASCVPPGTRAPAPTPPAARAEVHPGPLLGAMPSAATAVAIADTPTALPPEAQPFATIAQAPVDATRALDCLAAAVYYEARGESLDGQRAVAQVVLNRVRNPAFPASVCGVVYQGADRVTGCQFSFTCDGSMLARREPAAWEVARRIAAAALGGDVYAPVGTAAFFHTTAISPWWAPSLTPVATIGAHIFYRWPGAWGATAAFRQRYAGIEPVPGTAVPDAPDADDAIRFALDDGTTVSIHRGASEAVAGGAAESGVRIHRGANEAEVAQAVTVHRPEAKAATPPLETPATAG